MTISKRAPGGFTLLELLIAFGILAFLIILLSSLVSGVQRAWTAGEQQTSEFQDGRAILELIGRELSQAVISPSLQLIHDPSLPPGLKQRANSDSLFFLAPSTNTSSGDLAEIGYYLVEDHSLSGGDAYQLRRFFVSPSDGTNYQIFSPANRPTDNSAPWVTSFVANSTSSIISTGVLAVWIRCIDSNGDAIPWLSANAIGVGPLRYNSAAHFQPAIPGQSNSFKYTNAANTAQGNLLPTSVELVIVTLDPQSFRKNPTIPSIPSQANESDLPNVRDTFNQQLISNNVKNARTFATRVRLLNGPQ